MNRCEYCLENLSAYMDRELPEHEMKEIEEHLMKCASCSREFEILKTIVSACGELEEELPEGFISSLHERLEDARNDVFARKNKTGRIKLLTQIAAGFVIVVTLGFAMRFGLFDNKLILGNKTTSDAAPLAGANPTVHFSASRKSDNMLIMSGINSSGEAEEASEPAERDEKADDNRTEIQTAKQKDAKSPDDSGIELHFAEDIQRTTESEEYDYDTEIIIVVDDIDKAIDSIMAIDKKIGNNNDYLRDYVRTFSDIEQTDSVELKLVYTSAEAQQIFLKEIKTAFTNIQVETALSENEKEDRNEYIKVIIEKEKLD